MSFRTWSNIKESVVYHAIARQVSAHLLGSRPKQLSISSAIKLMPNLSFGGKRLHA